MLIPPGCAGQDAGMAEIVNLRRVKKQRAAAEQAAEAQRNRVLHGRTKGEKLRDRLEAERAASRAENARLDQDPSTEPSGT
jgi:hypothetical protein